MKTCVEPSSIVTGIETSIAFLQRPRTETRFGSISKVLGDTGELLAGQLEGVLAQVGSRSVDCCHL